MYFQQDKLEKQSQTRPHTSIVTEYYTIDKSYISVFTVFTSKPGPTDSQLIVAELGRPTADSCQIQRFPFACFLVAKPEILEVEDQVARLRQASTVRKHADSVKHNVRLKSSKSIQQDAAQGHRKKTAVFRAKERLPEPPARFCRSTPSSFSFAASSYRQHSFSPGGKGVCVQKMGYHCCCGGSVFGLL